MSRMTVAALLSGALFGLGLAMSGMIDARIVLGFLDVTGDFDPRLMFVLLGASGTTLIAFRFVLRQKRPLFAPAFRVSDLKQIDAPLLLGAALFGIGWGLAGYCPGPALAGIGVAAREMLWFIPAMVLGSVLHRAIKRS